MNVLDNCLPIVEFLFFFGVTHYPTNLGFSLKLHRSSWLWYYFHTLLEILMNYDVQLMILMIIINLKTPELVEIMFIYNTKIIKAMQ